MNSPQCKVIEDLWSERYQYETWVEVWKAVALAQARTGDIPQEAGIKIQSIRVDIEKAKEYEVEMHHDVNAAIKSVAESIPEWAARFLHFGLTSSDVVDTALCLRMVRSVTHLDELCDLRSGYPWPQSQILLARARREISVGKISGTVGTHATVSPLVEEYTLRELRLRPILSTQVVPRDCHSAYAVALAGVALAHGGSETGSVLIALENVPLWHERDISHSSNERIYLPAMIRNVDRLLHAARGDDGW